MTKIYTLKLPNSNPAAEKRELHVVVNGVDSVRNLGKGVTQYMLTHNGTDSVEIFIVDILGEKKSEPSDSLKIGGSGLRKPGRPEITNTNTVN